MRPFILAHLGHWVSLAFFGPVLVLPLGLYAVVLVERRRGGDEDEAISQPGPGPAAPE